MSPCVQSKSDVYIKLKQNRAELTIVNPQRRLVEIGYVDDCLIVGGHERCDYYVQPSSNLIFFIELKGSNVKKAVNQIISTVRILKEKSHMNKVGVIVCSKSPKQGTDFQIAKAKARKFCRDNALSFDAPKASKRSITV